MKFLSKISHLNLYMLDKEDNLDSIQESCYILTGEGLFLYKVNDLFKSFTKCNVPNTPDLKTFIDSSKLPKIPRKYIDEAISFFKKVYDIHKTESVLILYWNKNEFKWSCPKQTVSSGSVSYEEEHQGEGWIPILHIHSHASMSAFHSGTDDKDENNVDGYNVTVGKLNAEPEFESRIILGKVKVKCSMSNIFDNWYGGADVPNEWLNQVTNQLVVHTGFAGNLPFSGGFPKENCYEGFYPSERYGGLF
jgi:hypothetical protein